MDFTIKIYRQLLQTLQIQGFSFQTFSESIENNQAQRVGFSPLGDRGVSDGNSTQKTIILRHDVDLLPYNSLRFAEIQHEMGIKGSYYFRAVPESWDEEVIRKIAELGHEIGYHYECLTTTNGDMKSGIADFEKNLEALRKLAPVKTICMHGSPKSKWDSKDLWKEYDYRDYGIIGEPYFDVNFDEVFYLTDTGRRWDGWKVSVRDKVPQQEEWVKQGLVFRSTEDIIIALQKGRSLNVVTERSRSELPSQIMFTFHPQRWHASYGSWMKELVMQNVKNVVKRMLIAIKG